jgi:hypothetical protein
MTVPSGRTAGSAAAVRADTEVPAAVTRPVQYAVAVKVKDVAEGTAVLPGTDAGCVRLEHPVRIRMHSKTGECRLRYVTGPCIDSIVLLITSGSTRFCRVPRTNLNEPCGTM